MTINYTPRGVCSRAMQIEVEDNVIQNVKILGGCHGNLQAISRLLVGMTVDDAIAAVNSGVTDKYKLFIIVESIHDAKRMVEGCASIRQVNLGGTKKTPDKKAISKFIFATEQDVADIRAMVQAGAEVELRQVPSDGKIRAQDVI